MRLSRSVTVAVRLPRTVALLVSSTRLPERPWSRTLHGAEPWQRSPTTSEEPLTWTLVIVTGEVRKRTTAAAVLPPASLATSRK
jgi:hypothetical protein